MWKTVKVRLLRLIGGKIMPDYYAHLQFGNQVLAALPEALRVRLEREEDAYTLGQYGPDPLFFYHPIRYPSVRTAGIQIHRQPVRIVMERLRRAIEEKRAFSAGYAAGFLCHFALDSRCHFYIKQWAADSQVVHTCIESEFDRFLMVRNGLDPGRETAMPVPRMPDSFYALLEQYVYPGIKGQQYRDGLRFYHKLCCWHTKAAGQKLTETCLNLAVKVVPRAALLCDLVLKRQADPSIDWNEKLLSLLEEEAAVTAEMLNVFFSGGSLVSWFDRDFHGRVL